MTIAELKKAIARFENDWEVIRVNLTQGNVVALPPDTQNDKCGVLGRLAIRAACREWLTTPEAIQGKRRPMEVVKPRLAIYKLLTEHGLTTSEAGRQVGKGHGSVTHGVKSCNALLSTDVEYQRSYIRFESLFERDMERLRESDCNPGGAGNNVVAS